MDASDARPPLRWRVFAVFYVVLLGLGWGLLAATEGFGWLRAVDFVDFAMTPIGATGLIGFAFGHRIAGAQFWRTWAFVQPAWDLLYVVVFAVLGLDGDLPNSEPETVTERAVTIAVSLGLQAPLWLALFRYGHRSKELWNRARPSA